MGVVSTIPRNTQHALFCKLTGMPEDVDEVQTASIWRSRRQEDRHLKGLYPRVRSSYRWHTCMYWLVAVLSNFFLGAQIILGAALTALGGTKTDQVAVPIVLLGAIQTVISGFITYFKSNNQPNRARQYRVSLRKVLEAIENAEMILRDPDYHPPPYRPVTSNDLGSAQGEHWLSGEAGAVVTGVEGMVLRLMDMYTDAVRDAEANYPGTWASTTRPGEQAGQIGMKDLLVQLKKNGAVQEETASTVGSIAPAAAVAPPPTVASGTPYLAPQAAPAVQRVGPVTGLPTGPNAV